MTKVSKDPTLGTSLSTWQQTWLCSVPRWGNPSENPRTTPVVQMIIKMDVLKPELYFCFENQFLHKSLKRLFLRYISPQCQFCPFRSLCGAPPCPPWTALTGSSPSRYAGRATSSGNHRPAKKENSMFWSIIIKECQ